MLNIQKINGHSKPYLIFGDVHGCYDELVELIELAEKRYGKDITIISVGDLVDRGPGVHDVIRLCEDKKVHLVLGNHEEKIIRWKKGNPVKIRASQEMSIKSMTDPDFAYISKAAHYIELPDYFLKIVHGGFYPHLATEDQPLKSIIRLRFIRAGSMEMFKPGKQPEGSFFWADKWTGDHHVVFGHEHFQKVAHFNKATGIDTGCVFGGKLTGLIYLPDMSKDYLQVKAKKNYWPETAEDTVGE